jgi:endonuclease G
MQQTILVLIHLLCIPFFGLSQPIADSTILEKDSFQSLFLSPSSSGNQIIQHTNYSLSYNEQAEQADWVSYKLTPSSISNDIGRTNDFREDSLVQNGSATLADYWHSGYDRGHLAPAGSMKNDTESMSESFFMSNMSPQIPGFNRGVWKRLEEKVRYWVESNDSVFVTTGPILDKPIDTIGTNNVIVPRAYYKTLLAFKDDIVMGIAFLLPHEESDKSLYSFATSIDSIEVITGIDFYRDLEPPIQTKVEGNSSIKDFIYK